VRRLFTPTIFSEFSARGALAGFVGVANNYTTGRNPKLSDLAVLNVCHWQ